MKVANDPSVDLRLRVDALKAAAPFTHARVLPKSDADAKLLESWNALEVHIHSIPAGYSNTKDEEGRYIPLDDARLNPKGEATILELPSPPIDPDPAA